MNTREVAEILAEKKFGFLEYDGYRLPRCVISGIAQSYLDRLDQDVERNRALERGEPELRLALVDYVGMAIVFGLLIVASYVAWFGLK